MLREKIHTQHSQYSTPTGVNCNSKARVLCTVRVVENVTHSASTNRKRTTSSAARNSDSRRRKQRTIRRDGNKQTERGQNQGCRGYKCFFFVVVGSSLQFCVFLVSLVFSFFLFFTVFSCVYTCPVPAEEKEI